jgi:hydrogenase maturation protease
MLPSSTQPLMTDPDKESRFPAPACGSSARKILVMGVGNTLLQDDGIGVHVTEWLRAAGAAEPGSIDPALTFIDGGTIGLSLLPALEDADAVIVVDASELGERPGALRVFRGREIDAQLSGKRRTVHEVALADLFAAAAIRGRSPARRALIAIQPGCTEWGLKLSPVVEAAIPRACAEIAALARQWQLEGTPDA